MNAPIQVMGILNVTPDSFSDGGSFAHLETALDQADKLIADGADILDIGGESTRPFAEPVSAQKEIQRVLPVIKAVVAKHPSVPISIDTTKAIVASEALKAGATIINDISALRQDPEMISVIQKSTVPIIIMHMQGTPSDMQLKPKYDDVTLDVTSFLAKRIKWLTENGIDRKRIIVDPGIGFGKTLNHNVTLLKNLDKLADLGVPVLLGHSRKRFLGDITGIDEEKKRDLATAVVSALCADKNIAMIRVHDVASTRQALAIAKAFQSSDRFTTSSPSKTRNSKM